MIDIQQRRTASLTRPSTVQVTEVDIHLCDPTQTNRKLLAYANLVVNSGLVIRNVKVIRSPDGHTFVAMPSEKREGECPTCRTKNRFRSIYCNHCGHDVSAVVPAPLPDGQISFHKDVCFPINSGVRQVIEDAVMAAYREAVENERGQPAESEPEIYVTKDGWPILKRDPRPRKDTE